MAHRYEKSTGDLVFDGWENGVAPSPHVGVGRMCAVNTSTEMGEVMCSYARQHQSQTNATSGTLSFSDASHLNASSTIYKGMWITVSNTSNAGQLANGNYYVLPTAGPGYVLATTYDGSGLATYGSGLTANFSMLRDMGQPVASATEEYRSSTGTTYYRYYVLDDNGLVWVQDTQQLDPTNISNFYWFLPDYALLNTTADPSGIAVLNGYVMVFQATSIWCKSTSLLGGSGLGPTGTVGWSSLAAGPMMFPYAPHFAFTGSQSTLYYTDGNYIGSIFPSSGTPNIFSYYTFTTAAGGGGVTGTLGTNVAGSRPSTSALPVTIWSVGGNKPTNITLGTIYYLRDFNVSTGTFSIYAAASGGAAIDIHTGASGTLYFNTFNPIYAGSSGTYVFTQQACTLPSFETSQSMAELSNTIVIGCKLNNMYPWDQVAPQPAGIITLPENNAVKIITVNNMGYVFAGSKGNIYVTNGSTASMAIKVPDYTSGIIEPYFVWGDAMYLRGRVYFSIQDQFSGHTGQCGGVWSFIPTQNYSAEQDVGASLRLENQNSYGTYNGRATVLLPSREQNARGPQYFSGWVSNAVTSPTYGMDGSATTPGTTAIIETDIANTGTFLNKGTFKQVEVKLTAPLDGSSDAVSMFYRLNLSDSFTQISNTLRVTETNGLAMYWPVTFEKGVWVQFQAQLASSSSVNSSFTRMKEIRLR